MSTPRWLKQILQHYGVPFEEHRHPPVYSAACLAEAEHVSGYRVAKTVFLTGHGRPVAVVLPSCARLDVARVQALLGIADLRLATEAEIAGWFKGCPPGAVPPVRLRGDERILMDRSLAHLGKIVFTAGTPEDAVAVRFRDWYRAVRPGVGRFTQAGNGRASAPTPTVLVVEDEAATNELFCRLLEREGFACQGVEQGKTALALAPELRPSAILLDLMLPDISGFELVERLRRNGPLKRIPVVVVTALDDEACRRRGSQLGADAYLTKPFIPAKLVAELQGALEEA
jgi:CheY-like chemotaxis protein/prolyl-tRNA editing enzyme YbaK/EbsC (Cys-tRNA(Pro) deacylase)